MGSIIGLVLAGKRDHRKLHTVGGPAALGTFVVGVIFAIAGSFTPGNNRPATGNYLLMLGGQTGALLLLLWLVEFRGDPQRSANRRVVRALRTWGMVSLSIFSLDILQLPVRWLLGAGLGLLNGRRVDLIRHAGLGNGQEHVALFVALCVVLHFHLLIPLWSRADFKYSLEWFMVRLASLGSGEISSRLDVARILDEAEWQTYGQALPAPARQAEELPG